MVIYIILENKYKYLNEVHCSAVNTNVENEIS